MTRWIEAGLLDDLPPGGFLLVDGGEVELAVFNVDEVLYCIEDVCTHDGGNLVEGGLDGVVVTCPRHGATFDVRTGAALTLPAVTPTPTHRVRVRDGMIEIEADD